MDVSGGVVGFVDEETGQVGGSFGGSFGGWSTAGLGDEICLWAANLTAAEARWLALIAEFDRRQGWAGHGSASCAKWLQDRVGLDRSTAHEKVRVAHALQTFPTFALAMSAGVLPYTKLRSITRIATTDNADMLLEMALGRSSHQLERFVAAYRRCEAAADDLEARAFRDRSLSYRTEDASMVITIRVPVEAGAAFIASVDQFLNTAERAIPHTARRADAAIEMAEHAVANIEHPGTSHSQYLVTLHLTPDVFEDHHNDHEDHHDHDNHDNHDADHAEHDVGESSGHTVDGERSGRDRRNVCCVAPGDGLSTHPAAVPRKTAERILCDAVLHAYNINGGNANRVGPDRRFPSAKLQRALRLRDNGCMAPGCDQHGWLHAHHITHWTNGGPTIASNLVCLCRFHHRLVHEGGWSITGDANIAGGLSFHRPNGTTLPAGQPLITGHSEPIDIGCTADATRPGSSVQQQLDTITTTRNIRERCRQLTRKPRTPTSPPWTTRPPNPNTHSPGNRPPDDVDPFATESTLTTTGRA